VSFDTITASNTGPPGGDGSESREQMIRLLLINVEFVVVPMRRLQSGRALHDHGV
jgi:hypothetical protein